jgi:hypothetical protein
VVQAKTQPSAAAAAAWVKHTHQQTNCCRQQLKQHCRAHMGCVQQTLQACSCCCWQHPNEQATAVQKHLHYLELRQHLAAAAAVIGHVALGSAQSAAAAAAAAGCAHQQ